MLGQLHGYPITGLHSAVRFYTLGMSSSGAFDGLLTAVRACKL